MSPAGNAVGAPVGLLLGPRSRMAGPLKVYLEPKGLDAWIVWETNGTVSRGHRFDAPSPAAAKRAASAELADAHIIWDKTPTATGVWKGRVPK